MKVYSPPDNYKLDKILFASRVFEKQLVHVEVPFNNKNKQFFDAYPNCTMPALEYKPDKYLFGQHTILQLITPKHSCPFQSVIQILKQAQVSEWLQAVEKDIGTPTGALVLLQRGCAQISQEQRNKSLDAYAKFLKVLDDRLRLRTFIVGQSMTAADISIFFNIRAVREILEKQGKTKGINNVERWYKHLDSIAK